MRGRLEHLVAVNQVCAVERGVHVPGVAGPDVCAVILILLDIERHESEIDRIPLLGTVFHVSFGDHAHIDIPVMIHPIERRFLAFDKDTVGGNARLNLIQGEITVHRHFLLAKKVGIAFAVVARCH